MMKARLPERHLLDILNPAQSFSAGDFVSAADKAINGILERNRSMLRQNLEVMADWLAAYGDLFHFVPPKAGGMAFMRYELDINSTELADWLRTEKSVFILAGDCYGMDHYFRVGIGAEKDTLVAGLDRIREAFKDRFGV